MSLDLDIRTELLEKYADAKAEWLRVMKNEATISELSVARMKVETCAQSLADAALAAWMRRR